jgi:glycosyltransferase involved in cell wall biosynthesis
MNLGTQLLGGKVPKFSILTSFHIGNSLKEKQIQRCIRSVQAQGFTDYEHVLINDGSIKPLKTRVDKRHIAVEQPHWERINALREGMAVAKGEWFVFVDADDELFGHTLEMYNQAIEKYPDYKLFNFSSLHILKDYYTKIRGTYRPEISGPGHVVFGPGRIVNGTFIFHRSIYDSEGGFPPMDIEGIDTTEINYGGVRNLCMCSPWDFSAYAQVIFPEIREFFMIDKEAEPNKIIRELGNPWGNDFFLFYKYTRQHQSMPLEIPSVIIHEDGKEDNEGHYVQ